MNNLRKTIEILFKKKNPEQVISEYFNSHLKMDNIYFKEEEFLAYFRADNKSLYNKNEINNIHKLYCEPQRNQGIFMTLLKFSENILTEEKGIPLCKYENLFRWRELSFQVGEDILTTSFLAYEDLKTSRERNFFSWSAVIGNDNHRLNKILKKGVAENHFHLKGSGYHFNISWLSLMNNPEKREKDFKKLLKNKKLNPRIDIDFSGNLYDLELLMKKAAAIRLFLYGILIEKELVRHKDLKELLQLKSLKDYKLKGNKINYNSMKILYGREFSGEVPDYCIGKNISETNYRNKSADILLCGERFFLYSFFKKLYSNDLEILKYEKLFYTYILIKQQFRDEIIQVNRSVGFGNFGDYQNRKSIFIQKDSIYEKAIINSAVNSSLLNQSIFSLEARITPEQSMEKLQKEIERLDSIVTTDIFSLNKIDILEKSNLSKKEIAKYKFYYTLHFIKMESKVSDFEKLGFTIQCRNKKNREKVLNETLVISNIRKSMLSSRFRFHGIDAANTEIGCRPEVFALSYRYLKKVENHSNSFFEDRNLSCLGRTFHVAEEFLDIVDGLRALDECIKFLNFSHGDRIGHALALGINPISYYKSKDMILVLSKQDLLDNIAWILGKTIEKGIEYSSTLKFYLENQYKKYYHEIYEKNSVEECCYRTYYESWKLRGDSPEIYKTYSKEKCKKDKFPETFSPFSLVEKNQEEGAQLARNNEKAKMLYREYHYNCGIREEGDKIEEFKITIEYINLVIKLQKIMQREVSEKNISIETNPSSNYLIGTFDRYDEHPIANFFNLGLVCEPEKIRECPQISVSINTDDQGVFGTRIENEYALIALSLEKKVDELGNKVYNPSMIYDWINNIRKMGIEQSFFCE